MVASIQRILLDRKVPHVVDATVKPHSGLFNPCGIMLHHTATLGPALEVVKKGRADLAGPLCNINITRDGYVKVITDGKAYHAGKGSSKVLAEVRNNKLVSGTAKDRGLKDDTDGNPWFYGIEVDNDGRGELYPQVQINAILWTCGALLDYHGWHAQVNRIINHKEWTSRKIDMSYTGDIRKELHDLILYLGG